ncbi:helix-hairpin-helix domain-containing protein [Chryseobacterium taklimakanense]|uniref:Helix-hairpin-helix domain-containing protein n=1 Tax=Chryseobacterium taklimakanense TaxID=536441 RepID=A0A3G8WQB2_9FLAO|nr:helix-hairpin-helix domain-containing protein [Chryseobacterium taklimakanense]AZI20374.1 hypothetical protein EIH08_06290 [Chryseobacterium taklimakanense]
MKNNLPNRLRRRQYIALALFGVMVAATQFAFSLYKQKQKSEISDVEFKTNSATADLPIILTEFNPNDLDQSQWKNLGFTDRDVATILKYKRIIGGEFKSKEQFKKCYPIVDRYKEFEPYILLPETDYDAKKGNFTYKTFERKKLNIPGRFNPDHFSKNDWVAMGFSERQAEAILKYRNYLGGSFHSKEKLKACFIISEEQFAQMSPYVLLPEKTDEQPRVYAGSFKEKPKINYTYFDPNQLDEEGWKSLGFSEKQIAGIFNYKIKILRGSFRTLEDVQKCYMITHRFEELKPWIRFNPENIKEPEKTSYAKPEAKTEHKTDFSKVDLNEMTFNQLREFGFNEKTSGGFIAFRKSLGGFVHKNQIYEVYGIDRDLAEKLVGISPLNSEGVRKYTLTDAPESWLKTHPYFKYSADKIIFYRISNPDEKKIWKFIRTKPEYEAKMRMYLK